MLSNCEARKHFETLELSEKASWKEVKEAYHELLLIWHPDHHSHNEKLKKRAEIKARELNLAMDALRDYFAGTKHHREANRFAGKSADTSNYRSDTNYSQRSAGAQAHLRQQPLWLVTFPGFLRSMGEAAADLFYLPYRAIQLSASFLLLRVGFQLATVVVAVYLFSSAGNFGPIKDLRHLVKSATETVDQGYRDIQQGRGRKARKSFKRSSKDKDKGIFEILEVFEKINL